MVKTLLNLGRASNLPTVWTNILAAAVLAQTNPLTTRQNTALYETSNQLYFQWANNSNASLIWFGTLLALSMMYLGGMFLNDAFDAQWDKNHNPSRPIASGEISEKSVWLLGTALIACAIILIGTQYQSYTKPHFTSTVTNDAPSQNNLFQDYYGWLAAALLAMCIIAYNVWHKRYAHSAFIMGGCRLGVYAIAALLLAQLTSHVVIAAFSLLLYIAGLTYLARLEQANKVTNLWPLLLISSPIFVAFWHGYRSLYFWFYLFGFCFWVHSRLNFIIGKKQANVKKCILGLLAAVPLVDGLMLASVDAYIPSLICLTVFLLLPTLQRWITAT